MNLILLATATLALFAPHQNSIAITVDAKNGDTISGDHTFRVTVSTSSVVNQVEFYVNDALKDTETSTPYLFPLDTIGENDGDVRLRFKAYTTENQTAEKALTIHIDNQRGQGAAFHVKAGEDALTNKDWQTALTHGRIALILDPHSNAARVVLARANLGLNTYDKAQKFVEDAISQDASDDGALRLLAAIDAQRAFHTVAREGSDPQDVNSSISEAFKGAVDAWRKVQDLAVDRAGAPTGNNLIPYVDAALRAGRYSLAISTLAPAFRDDQKNNALGNRLAYAQVEAGRFLDAFQTLKDIRTAGKLDTYGLAILALVDVQLNDDPASDIAMKAAVESDPDDLAVRTAQTFIALKRSKTEVFSGLANDLGREQGARADVNYFLMALADHQQRYADARKHFETAVLADPTFVELYVEEADYNLHLAMGPNVQTRDKEANLLQAKTFYQTALEARPEAVDALAGLSVVAMFEKNAREAVRFAEAARNAAKEEALGHYVAAGAYELAGRYSEAQAESVLAGRLDKTNLEGRELPKPLAVWRYLNAGGRQAVISPPK